MDTTTLLIIIVVLLVLGGGWYGWRLVLSAHVSCLLALTARAVPSRG
jgi:hypothetical protein